MPDTLHQLICRAEYLGCTMLGRPKREVFQMTLGELLSQLSLHAHYTNGTQLKGTMPLDYLFR